MLRDRAALMARLVPKVCKESKGQPARKALSVLPAHLDLPAPQVLKVQPARADPRESPMPESLLAT